MATIENPKKRRLLVGMPGSGKFNQLLRAYVAQLQQSLPRCEFGRCLWIAPTHHCVEQVRDQIAVTTSASVLHPGVVTFARFANSLLAQSNRHVRRLTSLQHRLLLAEVVADAVAENRLKYFAPVAGTRGFVTRLAQTIADLKRRDIWAEKFAQCATNRRDRDLAILYGEYQRRLTMADAFDDEGIFWAARDALGSTVEVAYETVVVHGFTDFTEAQHDILCKLAGRAEQLSISLTLDAERILDESADAVRQQLFAKPLATLARLQQDLQPALVERMPATATRPQPLAAVRDGLFTSYQSQSAPPANETTQPHIRLLAARSVQAELESIAREVKQQLVSRSATADDIVVVLRDLGELAPRVIAVFAEFGVPIAVTWRPPLNQTALFRIACRLLELVETDWAVDVLLPLVANLRIGHFDHAQLADGSPRNAVETAVRATRVQAGKEELLAGIEAMAADDNAAAAAALLLEGLADLLRGFATPATPGAWFQRIAHVLSALNATAEADGGADLGTLRGLIAAAEMLGTWTSATEQPLSAGQFRALLETLAAGERSGSGVDPTGGVRILSADAARHVEAKCVFLGGLGESSFPRRSAGELVAFAAGEGSSSSDARENHGDEMLLFYELVTRATEQLILSYTAVDNKGQPLPPSPFVLEVQRLFGNGGLTAEDHTRETPPTEGNVLSPREHRTHAVARALEGDSSSLAAFRRSTNDAGVGSSILATIECIASRADRDNFGPWEGIFENEAAVARVAQRFNAEHLWSPSQLEEYGQCPFRFLATQVLGLNPQASWLLATDARRRGSLAHTTLAELMQQLGHDEVAGADEAAMVARFQAVLDAAAERTGRGRMEAALVELERREIASWAEEFARHNQQYQQLWRQFDEPLQAKYFEVRFGVGSQASETAEDAQLSTDEPFQLALDDETIRLTGQIDRIDVGRIGGVTVLVVIDYKSGKTVRLQLEEVRAGRQLQATLYAMAAEQLLFADRPTIVAASGYWGLRDRGFEFEKGNRQGSALLLRDVGAADLLDSQTWSELRIQMLGRLREMVDGVRNGWFPVENVDRNCKSFCDFAQICRVSQVRSLEKTWTPPEARSHA